MKHWLKTKRTEIEATIARLRARADRIEAHLTVDSRDALADPLDRAQLHENDEVVAALGSSAGEELIALEAALRRIDAGTYGTCSRCDEPIARGRLDALPATSECASCASLQAASPRGAP